MQHYVHQAAEYRRAYSGQRTHRQSIQHALADHAQAARPLGHHIAIGHERHFPWMNESLPDHRHMDAAQFRLKIPGACPECVCYRRPCPSASAWPGASSARCCLRCRLRRCLRCGSRCRSVLCLEGWSMSGQGGERRPRSLNDQRYFTNTGRTFAFSRTTSPGLTTTRRPFSRPPRISSWSP
jgi:hypothetical protein